MPIILIKINNEYFIVVLGAEFANVNSKESEKIITTFNSIARPAIIDCVSDHHEMKEKISKRFRYCAYAILIVFGLASSIMKLVNALNNIIDK